MLWKILNVDLFHELSYVMKKSWLRFISALREKLSGEITPVKADHSQDYQYLNKNAAASAIDLDLDTRSRTAKKSGQFWLSLTLDRVYCVESVVWFYKSGNRAATWTCYQTGCSSCVGDMCSEFSLAVRTKTGTAGGFPVVPGCKHGDFVLLLRKTNGNFMVHEIAVVGKGEMHCDCNIENMPAQSSLTRAPDTSSSIISLGMTSWQFLESSYENKESHELKNKHTWTKIILLSSGVKLQDPGRYNEQLGDGPCSASSTRRGDHPHLSS
jgi:hypothetical protein